MQIKKIIHVDMDAFFAAVEQRDNPGLRNKPVAVGGHSNRGVVMAASYEARKFGVRSAMASKIAAQKCPQLIFVPPRFDVYKSISREIRAIFHEYTDLVEPLSLDEAFLDVTHNKKDLPSATLIAQEIRNIIYSTTQLTASAGISINKFLAKVASDMNKPNGQFLIPPEKAQDFMRELPIEKFPYVGEMTTRKMHSLNILTGADILEKDQLFLIRHFGKKGIYYYDVVRCRQQSQVVPNRKRKSIGVENTFAADITDKNLLLEEMKSIAEELARRMLRSSVSGKTLTLKLKDADFKIYSKSKTVDIPISTFQQVLQTGEILLADFPMTEKGIRLLGLSVSIPETENTGQLTLDF